MKKKHKIRIRGAQPDGSEETVLWGGSVIIRKRALDRFLGGRTAVLILTPDMTVKNLEMSEMGEDDDV